MATNPRLPEEHDVHPKIEEQLQPKSRIPWVWVAIIVAGAMLLALIMWLPRAPRQYTPSGAQVPPQPTGSQIQLRDLTITPAPTGGSMYLQGQIVNTGGTSINGIQVEATFKGVNGANLETVRRPVEGIVGGTQTEAQNLTQAPIKPGEARPFRVSFDHLPEGWDHKLPALKIAAVTAAGNPGAGTLSPPILHKGQKSETNPRE